MDAVPGGSGDEELTYSKKELFLMLEKFLTKNVNINLEHLQQLMSVQRSRPLKIRANAMPALLNFVLSLETKWQASSRNVDLFLSENAAWLSEPMSFPVCFYNLKNPAKKSGCPSVECSSGSDRTKRRKTEDLRTMVNIPMSSNATQMSFRSPDLSDAAKVGKDVTKTNPATASKYRQSLDKKVESSLSADEALSLMVEAKFTSDQYNLIRSTAEDHNCTLFPNYEAVKKAKLLCYPHRSDFTITENSAEVGLQSLLDHTSKRILRVQEKVIKSLAPQEVRKLHLILKWGCDEGSGQSEYKQEFIDDTHSYSNALLTSLVPLQLVSSGAESSNEIVIWKNPRPSSPRFCRPISLKFLQENTESASHEVNHIEQQIESLVPLTIVVDGKKISIVYKMLFTAVDGAVCNAMSSTKSSLRCYLCGATSKNLNNIDMVLHKENDESNERFGMSILHAWIRSFECILHLSYNRTIGKWQARTKKDQKIVAERKRVIQSGFKSQLGLIVDRPKPGYGNTNNGYTARQFFKNPEVSALITGIDEKIIKRFHVILQAISSGYEIDIDSFQDYAVETARIFVEKYPWYYMPATVHKLLLHSPRIISSALLPIGQLFEVAQESWDKNVKKYREGFSRKCSKVKTMEGVFKWLMTFSDPQISSVRKLPQKKMKRLLPEAVRLLSCPTVGQSESSDDSDESDFDFNSDSDSDYV